MQDLEQGSGRVEQHPDKIRLLRPEATRKTYSNAQQHDYAVHVPPVSLRVTATFSHSSDQLRGTAGFGFWNNPYRGRLPRAAWFFFGSPPLNLPLAMDVPGYSFKMTTIDANTWQFLALLPTAPLGFLLMRIPALYRRLWKIGQQAIRVSEALVEVDMLTQHTYQIDWLADRVDFWVDGKLQHTSPYSPRGNMGVVIWLDNQYAVVTPQGNFGWGLVEADQPQWLDLFDVAILR